MPTEPAKDETPWAAIIAGLILAFVAFSGNKTPPQDDIGRAYVSAFADFKSGSSAVFRSAADKVDAKDLKTDRELLEFMRPLIEKARINARKPFDDQCEKLIPESFDGKEAEVSALLRKVGAL